MGLLFRLVLAALVSILVACGDGPARAVSEVRRIAVVPVAGETMQLARVGQLPFANRRAQLDVSDWDLRDETYLAVKDVLERSGRYAISRLDTSPDVVPALHAAAGQGACRDRNARRELSRLADLCACDAMLLIIDDRRQLETDRAQYNGKLFNIVNDVSLKPAETEAKTVAKSKTSASVSEKDTRKRPIKKFFEKVFGKKKKDG